MGDLLIEDRDGCMHDPIKTAEMLDGYADHASAGMDDSLYDAADVMRGLVNRLDDAEARAREARDSIADAIEAARQRGVCVERDGEPKPLLVVVGDMAHALIGLRGAYEASSRALARSSDRLHHMLGVCVADRAARVEAEETVTAAMTEGLAALAASRAEAERMRGAVERIARLACEVRSQPREGCPCPPCIARAAIAAERAS